MRSERGITMTSLIIVVIILLILAGTTIYSVVAVPNIQSLNKMRADITTLRDKVLIYYNKYKELPTTETSVDITDYINASKLSESDSDEYYEIDPQKIENLSLNFGKGTSPDVYVINAKTFHIYYLKGAEYNGTKYYSMP